MAIHNTPADTFLAMRQITGAYATVSRGWQAIVEPITFASLNLNHRRIKDARAKDILTPARQYYVRYVKICVELPNCQFRENPLLATRQNSEAFFRDVAEVLEYVNTWTSPPSGLQLSLDLVEEVTSGENNREDNMAVPRYLHGQNHNAYPGAVAFGKGAYRRLPEVPKITSFRIGSLTEEEMFLNPKSACEIASRFPNLRTIDWVLEDGYQGWDYFASTNPHIQRRN